MIFADANNIALKTTISLFVVILNIFKKYPKIGKLNKLLGSWREEITGIKAANEKASETPLNNIKKSNKINCNFLVLLKNLKIEANTVIELLKLIDIQML